MTWIGHEAANIPAAGFDWYVFVIEDGLRDEIRDHVRNNFIGFGNALGGKSLVASGYDPNVFAGQIEAAYTGICEAVRHMERPALVIADTAPAKLAEARDSAFVMVFQLQKVMAAHGSVANFFAKLVITLKDPAAKAALKSAEPGPLERGWGWLGEYVKVEPKLFGCSIAVNKVIRDTLKLGDRALRR